MNFKMSELAIYLLGTFEVWLNNEPIDSFRTKSVQALLAYLVCAAERPSSREQLMDLLWPGMPLKSAQANLRQTIYRLRQLIPEVQGPNGEPVPLLITNRQTIQINPDASSCVDVHEFVSLIDSDPEKAIELYRGDFLTDFYLADSETFEEWANNQREVYRRQVLEAMEAVTAVSIQNSNYEKAIQLAQRQLEIDNLRESSHRQLMEGLARNGRRQEALSHYDKLRQLLQDELAIKPEPDTISLIEAIRAGELSKTATTPNVQSAIADDLLDMPIHNLPQRITSFVGREKELEEITNLVMQNRLVMLTGVGGIGKTNLCLQVGQGLLETFPDGVWLIELAPIADPALVTKTTANTLGLRESSEQAISPVIRERQESSNRSILQILLDFLRDKNCLLILDNCEHVIDSAAQLVKDLLQACADVKVLASSREALGVSGELPYRVPSLSLPKVNQPPAFNEWEQYDALHLFVERATAVSPEFQLTEDNFAAPVQICQRLDGIPLALELAAARVRVLNIAQIATRLDDRFRLLTGGSRTALPRQQTLRALIDWSWELLTESEQLLLQRLSVFAGGMTLAAVEAVCAGNDLDSYALLDLLSELVNKSLVLARREKGEEMRYRLLETIRQYAQERLLITGQGTLFRQYHLTYFRQWAETVGPELIGPKQAVSMKRIEKELDNIRVAINWARETDVEAGLRLLVTLKQFWEQGYMREGEKWLTQLLTETQSVEPAIKANALEVQGILKAELVQSGAKACLEESLVLYQSIDDPVGVARLRYLLAHFHPIDEVIKHLLVALVELKKLGSTLEIAGVLDSLAYYEAEQNNFEQAKQYLKESELLYRELGHLSGIADVLENLGLFAIWAGDFAAAREPLEEGLVLQQKLGVRNYESLHRLGFLYSRLGNFDKAITYFDKCLAIAKHSGDNYTSYWVLTRLGYIYLWMGDSDQAEPILRKSLHQFNEAGIMAGIAFSLEGLANLAVQRQQAERAVRLFAVADALRKMIQNPRPPTEQADVDLGVVKLMHLLGEEMYTAVYAEGYEMTVDEAVVYALNQS